jgi:hypothetical protein
MNWPKSPLDHEELHRGPIFPVAFEHISDVDGKALVFIMTERDRVHREFHEGCEAAERVLNNGRKVWSVGHDPGAFSVEDEIALTADEIFARLPDDKRYKLQKKLQNGRRYE